MPAAAGRAAAAVVVALQDDDALLEQMLVLENKIAADLARKPKHQKPAQRAEWQRALQVLRDRLG